MMLHRAFSTNKRQTGVTLIELIIVIIVLGAGVTAILPFFMQTAQTVTIGQTLQTSAELARECAEQVITSRRHSTLGFNGIDNTVCDVIPAFPAYTRTVTVTSVTNATVPLCPASSTCKQVDIDISQAGVSKSKLSLLLVSY